MNECADAFGGCRSVYSRWQEDQLRIGTAAAPGVFITMPPKDGGPPKTQKGYPPENQPEAIWEMLLQSDNSSFLLATKQARYLADGFFLDLPPGPWAKDEFIQPVQSKPVSAKQAAWVIEPAPQHHQRLRHVASGRYLMIQLFKPTKVNTDHTAVPMKLPEPVVTTCSEKFCEPGAADMEIWPKTEHPTVAPQYAGPRAPWQ